MAPVKREEQLVALVTELASLPHELEWVEFKENIFTPEVISEYISALANGATLTGQPRAYMVWGVDDTTHEIVGTDFDPFSAKKGNEDLQPWLVRSLHPQIHFEFNIFTVDDKRVVLLEIDAANTHPVRSGETAYIRVGSYKKKLKDYPELERRLWKSLEQASFESASAITGLNESEVLSLIDYPSYFELMGRPLPETRSGILDGLASDSIVAPRPNGTWDATNIGAILFARDFTDFPSLQRKALRVIQYRGNARLETMREQVSTLGYASGFKGVIGFINTLLPANEIIGEALRQDVRMFPELAIRELIANALIHQDFTQTGNGPMVEIFDRRIEITSPGRPLIEPARFIDAPPKSRNEALASMMRRAGICEERGSGWDKVASETEIHQLPAPLVETPETPDASTRVTLFGPKPLKEMDRPERMRAVYQHACLRFVMREELTNASLRARFGVAPQSTATVSRMIAEAVESNLIVPVDPNAGNRYMRYVPWWGARS